MDLVLNPGLNVYDNDYYQNHSILSDLSYWFTGRIMPPHGPYFNKLLIEFTTRRAIPPGGGIADAVKFFTDPLLFRAVLDRAEKDTIDAIELIRTAQGNPYGPDEETIAKGILDQLAARRRANQNRAKSKRAGP